MPTPHKHAEIIKAWADGHPVQYWDKYQKQWKELQSPCPGWGEDQYRIKPEPVVLEGFIDPLMLSYHKNSYAIFRPDCPAPTYKRCTITIHPDE